MQILGALMRMACGVDNEEKGAGTGSLRGCNCPHQRTTMFSLPPASSLLGIDPINKSMRWEMR